MGWRSGRRMLDRREGLLAIAAVLDGASRAETGRLSPHFSHCNLVLQRIIWF